MMPRIATTIEEIREVVRDARQSGRTIGLVPTMGALHAGHASLMEIARQSSDFVIVSIFVNPTQFGPNEDFSRYPRMLEKDIEVCTALGVDLVFAPDAAAIFPPGFRTYVEVTDLQDVLCGPSRPGHFRGVATVVLKLFNIVQPDLAVFGQKDAQQVRILQQMTVDLDLPVRIIVGAIVREPDGLALSSRNQYLDAKQRRQATALYQSLREVHDRFQAGQRSAASLLAALLARIESAPAARLEYAAIVDAENLRPVERIEGRALVALAVWFGSTRLIDNVILESCQGASG
jgi:pantoate--beta-alanine ligase